MAPGSRAPSPPAPNERFVIREATAADLPAVYALLAEAGPPGDGVAEQFGDQYAAPSLEL